MTSEEHKSFEVGDWYVDPGQNRVSRDLDVRSLRPKTMDVLVFLAGRQSRVTSADELIEALWPGVFVSDASVYACINQLRQAFGDDSDHPEYIETIPKRGYRLTVPVNFDASIAASDGKTAFAHPNYKLMGLATAALLAAISTIYALMSGGPPQDNGPIIAEQASIAVMPFVDLSPGGDQKYFSEGISEELLNSLARIEGLQVSGRTSSFSFKGQEPSATEIGEALGVATILEGSVRREGNRVRIAAQLVSTKDGFQLWSETYEREMSDIFAVQDEISRAIVAALRVEFTGEAPLLVTVGTTNMEAYDFYLHGRSEFAKRSADGLLAATAALEEAVRLDPGYADAWGTLALVYTLYRTYSVDLPRSEALAKGGVASKTAITLDPENIRALLASARHKHYEWDFEGAEQDFVRALTLSPNDAEVNNFYGDYLRDLMDYDRGIALKTRVTELDPLFAVGWLDLGLAFTLAGRDKQGLAAIARGRSLAPNLYLNYTIPVFSHFYAGRYQEARQAFEKWEKWFPRDSFLREWDVNLTLREGNVSRANAMIDAQLASFESGEINPFKIGFQLYKAGRTEEARFWLDKAYNEKHSRFPFDYRGGLGDPRVPFKDPAIAEIYARPGLKELMDIRRRNLGLDAGDAGNE